MEECVQYLGWFMDYDNNLFGYAFGDKDGNEDDHYRSTELRNTTFVLGGWYLESDIEESLRTGYAVRVPIPGH